ncbi:lytic transglycosylase domain-containing protein [Halomonas casei]|uniref:lytic transglycosylase domain-containing protein n=1 Tax=Halomonas casei TaxID=2742613 RepID=UPI003CECED65
MLDVVALMAMCAGDVHPQTMQAVIGHESRENPYAIGINDGERLTQQPTSKEEAVAIATQLEADGRSWDGGIAQISNGNFEWLGYSIDDVFDPCKSLAGGAKILEECYGRAAERFEQESEALSAALSCYNTGNFQRGLENGYVEKVMNQVKPIAEYRVPALVPGSPQGSGAADNDTPVRLSVAANSNDQTSNDIFQSGGDAFSSGVRDAFQ